MSDPRVKVTLIVQIGDLEIKVKADSVKPVKNPIDFLNVVYEVLKNLNEELAP